MQPVPESTFASTARHDRPGETETTDLDSSSPDPLFWIGACLGTTLAGGVFGFFLGGIAGYFVGTILAALYSIPLQFSAAVLSWALWLTRFRIGLAALAGGLTGVSATVLTLPTSMYGSLATLSAYAGVAGVLGALGAGTFTSWMTFKTYVGRELQAAAKARKWQFSLGSLLTHYTVVCMLLAFWTLAIGKILDVRRDMQSQQDQTTQQLTGNADQPQAPKRRKVERKGVEPSTSALRRPLE
jgi:hypothetical protein